MKYCSIDVETTGLDPETCDLLEVGAVVDDLSNREVDYDKLPRFHCYVVKNSYTGEPFALSMHGTIFRRIAEKTKPYLYLEDAFVATSLAQFLALHFGKEKIIAAGKNFLGLDKPFLSKLPGFKDLIKLHHRPLDPGMMYWYPTTDKEVPSSKECMTRAGLAGEVAHTAVEDALMVIKLIRNKAFQ